MPTPSPKHDTVFQSDDGGTPGDWAALVVDDSTFSQDLTQGTTGTTKGYLDESAGDKTNLFTVDPEFNVTVRFNHNTGNSNGYLYARQIPSGTIRHGLLVNASSFTFVVNNSVLSGTLTMPGTIPASDGDDLIVSWSGRANPLTTGASDAMYNEVVCWNETDGGVTKLTFTSEVPSSLSTADVTFGGRHPAISTQDYSGEVIDIHYGTRFRSTTETYNDWIAAPAAPTLTGDAPLEVPLPDVASGFGAENEMVGPVFALTGACTRRNSLLTASPLVNAVVQRSVPAFLDDLPDPSRWRSSNVPNGAGFSFVGQYMWYRHVPHNCNRLKVWLHVQNDSTDNLALRVYSLNVHPDRLDLAVPGEETADALEYYYGEVTVPNTDSHGTGTTGGAWYEFDPIKIARAPGDEFMLLCLASDSQDVSFRPRAVHVEPLSVEASSPGDVDGLHFG